MGLHSRTLALSAIAGHIATVRPRPSTGVLDVWASKYGTACSSVGDVSGICVAHVDVDEWTTDSRLCTATLASGSGDGTHVMAKAVVDEHGCIPMYLPPSHNATLDIVCIDGVVVTSSRKLVVTAPATQPRCPAWPTMNHGHWVDDQYISLCPPPVPCQGTGGDWIELSGDSVTRDFVQSGWLQLLSSGPQDHTEKRVWSTGLNSKYFDYIECHLRGPPKSLLTFSWRPEIKHLSNTEATPGWQPRWQADLFNLTYARFLELTARGR